MATNVPIISDDKNVRYCYILNTVLLVIILLLIIMLLLCKALVKTKSIDELAI